MVLDRLADEEILMMDGGKRGRKVLVKGFEVDRDRWYCFRYDELINREAPGGTHLRLTCLQDNTEYPASCRALL